MNECIKNNFRTCVVAVASLLGLGAWIVQNKVEKPSAPPAMQQQPMNHAVSYIPPAMPAPIMSPQTVQDTISFTVLSVGRPANGMIYLNSRPNYRQPGNDSIRLTPGAFASDPITLIGKVVQATGSCRPNNTGGKDVTVSNAAQLVVR